eukprot:CAMPEP_0117447852 /NCGR_PEP_ID=MMETSP0759-20121206/7091_1 /TAXON_ID=63605 /ORGANISM="Percolomonas cosmopolitus, Strain WS" /LENGTH=116 /DNA_ID=CAMNT_0005240205 /DNA_START=163 /DNA_END=513 /DNA_ORIENTATION=-
MCRDCVWNEYFMQSEKYEAWSKKHGKGNESDDSVLDPNIDMFAKLEKRLLEQRNLRELARKQQRSRVNIVFDVKRSNSLRLYLEVMRNKQNQQPTFGYNKLDVDHFLGGEGGQQQV